MIPPEDGGGAYWEYSMDKAAAFMDGVILGDYSLDWATYDATVDADVVSITITMEEGWPDDFTVLVSEEDGYLVVVGFE